MTYAPDIQHVENARLLLRLLSDWKASDLGNIGGFFQVPIDWRCPCCFRDKTEIVRLDKNGHLLCRIVEHHDHIGDYARGRLRRRINIEASVISFSRFSPTFICEDCNVFEGALKIKAGARPYFSFTPYEIAALVLPSHNSAHDKDDVDHEKLMRVCRAAEPALTLLLDRLRITLKALSTSEAQ